MFIVKQARINHIVYIPRVHELKLSCCRLAAAEIMKEVSKARTRAEVGGPSEWTKKPKRLNMKFLINSVLQAEAQNRRISKK